MSSSVGVLSAMLNYDLYTKYYPIIMRIDNLEPEIRSLLTCIEEYYSKYRDNKRISVSELKIFFDYLNPSISNPEYYDKAFEEISTTKIENEDLLIDMLNRMVEQYYMATILHSCIDYRKGEGISKVESYIKEYKELVGDMTDAEADVCKLTLAELLAEDQVPGLKWRLPCLNDTIGPLRKGYLGHVFARSETGKTSFALDQCAYFAYQLRNDPDACVLYLNNEEDIKRLQRVIYRPMLGASQEWIEANVVEAEETWIRRGGDKIKMIEGVLTIEKVENHIRKLHPSVVVIDQGPKVALPSSKDSDTKTLQKLYNRYRQMATEYKTTILTLGQADSVSENRKWLGLTNLDSSKVGIPGELDFAIGIGMINEPEYDGQRFINVAKNKLTGRKGRFTVHLDIEKCRYS